MLSDACSDKDCLQRSDIVREIGDRVMTCALPQVFGVSGDWGSGKTNFLRHLQGYLTGTCPITGKKLDPKDRSTAFQPAEVVWFEAWRYQNEAQPIVALLHEMREQLGLSKKVANKGKKLGEVTLRASFAVFNDALKQIKLGDLSNVQEIGEKWESERFYSMLGVEAIRGQLEYAIDQLLGNDPSTEKRRLVVLIDDLDRCHPDAAFQLLEGLKIFLNLKNCAFVLGMNLEVVEKGIAQRYKDMPGDAHIVAREYLEKICQNVWHLPLIGRPDLFLDECLKTLLDETPEATKLPKGQFFNEVVQLAKKYGFVSPNPRRIKSFANLLDRQSTLYEELPPNERTENVAYAVIFSYLYQNCQPIYRVLQLEPDFYEKRLVPWAQNPPQERSMMFDGTQEAHAVDHPAFAHLKPVLRATQNSDKRPPGADTTPDTRFADPVHEGYFRIQRLVLAYPTLPPREMKQYRLQS